MFYIFPKNNPVTEKLIYNCLIIESSFSHKFKGFFFLHSFDIKQFSSNATTMQIEGRIFFLNYSLQNITKSCSPFQKNHRLQQLLMVFASPLQLPCRIHDDSMYTGKHPTISLCLQVTIGPRTWHAKIHNIS